MKKFLISTPKHIASLDIKSFTLLKISILIYTKFHQTRRLLRRDEKFSQTKLNPQFRRIQHLSPNTKSPSMEKTCTQKKFFQKVRHVRPTIKLDAFWRGLRPAKLRQINSFQATRFTRYIYIYISRKPIAPRLPCYWGRENRARIAFEGALMFRREEELFRHGRA